MLKQMEELGMHTPVVSNWNAESPDLIAAAAQLADGVVYTYHYQENSTRRNALYSEEYRRRYAEAPEAASATTYDAVYIIKHLVESCQEEVDCMVREMNRIEDYEGASGVITIRNGTTEKGIYLKKVYNGRFVAYESGQN
jgi:ABC-type branched-subunit amino acid transport system substrate-binding protein